MTPSGNAAGWWLSFSYPLLPPSASTKSRAKSRHPGRRGVQHRACVLMAGASIGLTDTLGGLTAEWESNVDRPREVPVSTVP